MRKSSGNVFALVASLAALSAHTAAQADVVYVSGNDDGAIYTVNFEESVKCRLYWRPAGDNLFSFSASGVLQGGTFVFSSPNYQPLGPGNHRFFFKLSYAQGDETLSYEIEPLTFEDGTHGYRFGFKEDLLTKLARAKSVTLAMSDGRELKDISLAGSSHAIRALEECSYQFEPALIAVPESAYEEQQDGSVTARCINSQAVFTRGGTRITGGECLNPDGPVYYRARTFPDGRTIILQNVASDGLINTGTAIFIGPDGTSRKYGNLYVTSWLRIWSPRSLFYFKGSTGQNGSIFNPEIAICEVQFDWPNMRPVTGSVSEGEIAAYCSEPI